MPGGPFERIGINPQSTGTPGQAGGTSDVTPSLIWQQLTTSGLSAVQAAGVMGNAIAESSLNPEAVTKDSNGANSYGLFQFNLDSYPGAASLVTGDPLSDAYAQIQYFLQVVPQTALQGDTPAQVASNVASGFERCQTCGPGGKSNLARQSFATTAAGWAQADNWPSNLGAATDTATLAAADQAKTASACLVGINGFLGIGSICFLSRSQARALLAGGILVAGGLLALFAVSSLTGISLPGGALGGALAGSVVGPEGAAAGAVAGARRSAQDRHDESIARQVEARRRDSPRGPALRDEPPF